MNPNKAIWIISQFSGAPQLGGVQRHFWLADHWRKKGFHPIIIADPQHHLLLEEKRVKKRGIETVDGVDFYWIPSGKHPQTSVLRFLPMMIFALKLCFIRLHSHLPKPDILILSTMSIFPVPALFFLKWRFQVRKTIVEVRDLWPLTPILMHGVSAQNPLILYMKFLESWAYKKADAIVSVLSNANAYIDPISQNPKKFTYISNGIPDRILDLYTVPMVPKKESSKIRVTYAGSLGIGNGMEPFVAFLAKQSDTILQKFSFQFIGSGYLKPKYQKQLSNIPNVSFQEKVTREVLHHKLQSTDLCFIAWHDLPLYRFGVGAQKYFDYMAAAKPILAAHSGIPDFVQQSKAGIICDNSPEGIEEGLLAFASLSLKERIEMGTKAHTFVQQYRYSNLADQYLKVLAF